MEAIAEGVVVIDKLRVRREPRRQMAARPEGGFTSVAEVRKAIDVYSKSASDLARNLCFAGIGAIWAIWLGGSNSGGIRWQAFLLVPLACFLAALFVDMLHYIVAARRWQRFHAECEAAGCGPETMVSAPQSINSFGDLCWNFKVRVATVGQVLLLGFVVFSIIVVINSRIAGATPALAQDTCAAPMPAAAASAPILSAPL